MLILHGRCFKQDTPPLLQEEPNCQKSMTPLNGFNLECKVILSYIYINKGHSGQLMGWWSIEWVFTPLKTTQCRCSYSVPDPVTQLPPLWWGDSSLSVRGCRKPTSFSSFSSEIELRRLGAACLNYRKKVKILEFFGRSFLGICWWRNLISTTMKNEATGISWRTQ